MTRPRFSIGADVAASIVVYLVALPLCMGIAIASEAPPFAGVIAGIAGGIVTGLISKSPLSVSGPAAGLSTIVASSIMELQVYEAFLVAVVLAGVFQIIFGIFKLGMFGDFVPNPVIRGMLAAIGITIFLKQIPHLVGYDKTQGSFFSFQEKDENTITALEHAAKFFTPGALIIGLLSLLLIVLWELGAAKQIKFFKLVPGPLMAVLLGLLINLIWINTGASLALEQSHLVHIPVAGSVSELGSFIRMPDFSQLLNFKVWTIAGTIAMVASLETLLSLEAVDKLDPLKRVSPPNGELRAQGIGNIVSGMLGGIPITSVIVRSSANVNAGGKTKISTVLHGFYLLLSVALLAKYLNHIPMASLAAILVFTGYKLAKPALFKEMFAKGLQQFIPFLVTILAILATDLLIGVLVGICIGLYFILRSNFKSAIRITRDGDHVLVKLRDQVSFLNKAALKKSLEDVPDDAVVIIDASTVKWMDPDVLEVITDYQVHAPLRGIKTEVRYSPKMLEQLSNS